MSKKKKKMARARARNDITIDNTGRESKNELKKKKQTINDDIVCRAAALELNGRENE